MKKIFNFDLFKKQKQTANSSNKKLKNDSEAVEPKPNCSYGGREQQDTPTYRAKTKEHKKVMRRMKQNSIRINRVKK